MIDITLLIFGGRDYPPESVGKWLDDNLYQQICHLSYEFNICPYTSKPYKIIQVVHGAARGADTGAELWAFCKKLPIMRFPADWKTYGRKAGPIRNDMMAAYLSDRRPALAIAFLGGAGTADMIKRLERRAIPLIKVS